MILPKAHEAAVVPVPVTEALGRAQYGQGRKIDLPPCGYAAPPEETGVLLGWDLRRDWLVACAVDLAVIAL